ncbi:NTP transferase domain-containing protein [Deinococcus aquiradiocola]|uniref:Nucleotide-diphospho-sugar transferase n=1 Tax=Deinococcus aquiradiocola TaxID=393059 RepID=A0A917PNC9_9DEIO|nr:NTP transferase domain-containing protein [Deinococcus aquiradiocola]GGJ85808.1 nucleotide-diphospho-sugar transferase [Deinococcus aquiradiocola]
MTNQQTAVPAARRWDVVVLGGGDPGDPFAAAHGVAVKPLVPVAGAPMALHVLRALRACPEVGRVAYVGPVPPGAEALVDLRVTDHGSLLGNVDVGVNALRLPERERVPGQPERVMVMTADIPMVTPAMLSDLLAAAPDAGLVYPVVRREACEAAYPGVRRTYARLKDGTFTGGNLFLLDASLVGQFLPRLREVLAARKQPLKLAALIGWPVLLKLLTGRLAIHELEERVSGILGVQARALVTPHAAIGTDVDKDADLDLAQTALGQG